MKPTAKQPFIGIWFHDNRLPIDKQNRMKLYLNRIFYYYRIYVNIEDFSDYIGNKQIAAKIFIIISDLEQYEYLIKLTQRHKEIFEQVYVFLTVEVPVPTCFKATDMEMLYERLSQDVFGIINDTRSEQQFAEDELYDELNPKNFCHVNQIPPSLSVFDKQIEQNTPIRHLTKESLKFLYFLTMMDILLRMSHTAAGKTEMWAFCRKIYEKYGADLKHIDNLSQTYDASQAIKYYTGNSCLSRTVNQVCRTENFQHIFKFRNFITDLHNQLDKYGSEEEQIDNKLWLPKLYRGKVLSGSVLQQLIDNKDGLISMNGFLSTTVDSEVAGTYAGDDQISDGYRQAKFGLQINEIQQPYAYISGCSHKKEELEVLFSVGTIWRIESVNYNNSSCTIELTSCDKLDSQRIELFKKCTGEGCTLLSVGDILFELGDYDEAKWVYEKMLDENNHPDDICRDLHYRLGIIRFNSKDYSTALEKFKKVESLFQKSNNGLNKVGCSQFPDTNSNRIPFVTVYNCMGIIFQTEDKFEEAIKYYEKALKEKASPPELATVHNNLGCLYFVLGSYDEARIHLTKAVDNIGDNEPPPKKFQEDLDRIKGHLNYITTKEQ